MAAGAGVTAFVDQLIELFHQRSLDLPDGYFTRHTQLLLNGVPFEELLGRPSTDPLILMLTRGAAGYRFTVKGLQHAVPDATLQRGELQESQEEGRVRVRAQCWLSGHLRGAGERVDILADLDLRFRGGALERAEATVDPLQLARLRDARHRA